MNYKLEVRMTQLKRMIYFNFQSVKSPLLQTFHLNMHKSIIALLRLYDIKHNIALLAQIKRIEEK